MKFRYILFLAIAGAIVLAPRAEARKAGITGAAFLKVGVGARMAALGQAATTVTKEPNQLFLNPSGFALKSGQSQVTFTYNKWIADIAHNAAAVTFGTRIGTLGVGFISMGKSKIDANRDVIPGFLQGIVTANDANTSATYDYSDTAILFGYANQVTDKLSLGSNMKILRESIDSQGASSLAFDFAAIYQIGFHGASVGARISNIGKDMKFFTNGVPLPLIFSVGASFDLVKNAKHSLMIRADAAKPQDANQIGFSGGEYVYNDMLFLRGAWKFNYSGTEHTYGGTNQSKTIKDTEEKGLVGAGVKLPMGKHRVAVDYAYTGFGTLNNVHRFSIGIDLK